MNKVFHHDDADGRGGAYIISTFKKIDKFYELNYEKPFPENLINEGDIVYIVDYSFKLHDFEMIKRINEKAKKLIWIDHHDSSIELEENEKYIEDILGIRSKEHSGMGLAAMYLTGSDFEELPRAVQLVSDFDNWNKEIENSEEFILGLQCYEYGPKDKIWDKLMSNDNLCDELISKGKTIMEYNKTSDKDYLNKYGYTCKYKNYNCIVINRKVYSSFFGENFNKYDLCVSYIYKNGKYVHSIFTSKKDVDCMKIASEYAGGGYRKVSGFTTDKLIFK